MDRIDNYIEDLGYCLNMLDQEMLEKIADEIIKCEGTIYILGNGGSHATATHFSCDLSKNTGKAIRTNTLSELSKITAYANDEDFAYIYDHQLRGILTGEDLLINISNSGNSKDLVCASYYARNICKIISLLGRDGGELKHVSDFCIFAPSSNIKIVEDTHSVICHILTDLVQKG